VLFYTVAQRTKEIGLRMALGATPGRVRAMVLRQVSVMTLIGGGVSLAAAVGLGRAAQSMLFQLNGLDSADRPSRLRSSRWWRRSGASRDADRFDDGTEITSNSQA
jgi:ABC-type antimicrobial peptide transport system permease subunit